MRPSDTSNKPFEWTGNEHLSSSPPKAPSLPLKGSVSGKNDDSTTKIISTISYAFAL
jgi:hypothetical protein